MIETLLDFSLLRQGFEGQMLSTYFITTLVAFSAILLIQRSKYLKKFGLAGIMLSFVFAGIIIFNAGPPADITMQDPLDQTKTITGTPRNIRIKNSIEQNMLKYEHWTGTYEPTTFALAVNNKEIKPGTQTKTQMIDGIIAVRFDYAFLNGKRKGAKIIIFEVDENTKDLNITFEWKDKWQVLIENATPVKKQKAKFNMELLEG